MQKSVSKLRENSVREKFRTASEKIRDCCPEAAAGPATVAPTEAPFSGSNRGGGALRRAPERTNPAWIRPSAAARGVSNTGWNAPEGLPDGIPKEASKSYTGPVVASPEPGKPCKQTCLTLSPCPSGSGKKSYVFPRTRPTTVTLPGTACRTCGEKRSELSECRSTPLPGVHMACLGLAASLASPAVLSDSSEIAGLRACGFWVSGAWVLEFGSVGTFSVGPKGVTKGVRSINEMNAGVVPPSRCSPPGRGTS
eukprot:1175534-Prorocentrum_minimum.AAC.4